MIQQVVPIKKKTNKSLTQGIHIKYVVLTRVRLVHVLYGKLIENNTIWCSYATW